jgi:hypothetical protein
MPLSFGRWLIRYLRYFLIGFPNNVKYYTDESLAFKASIF